MSALLEVENLAIDFRTDAATIHAVRGISLDIHKGEFIAIMGASGSGKSTLMNTLGCLDRPTRGDYLLDGINVDDSGRLQQISNEIKTLITDAAMPGSTATEIARAYRQMKGLPVAVRSSETAPSLTGGATSSGRYSPPAATNSSTRHWTARRAIRTPNARSSSANSIPSQTTWGYRRASSARSSSSSGRPSERCTSMLAVAYPSMP